MPHKAMPHKAKNTVPNAVSPEAAALEHRHASVAKQKAMRATLQAFSSINKAMTANVEVEMAHYAKASVKHSSKKVHAVAKAPTKAPAKVSGVTDRRRSPVGAVAKLLSRLSPRPQ